MIFKKLIRALLAPDFPECGRDAAWFIDRLGGLLFLGGIVYVLVAIFQVYLHGPAFCREPDLDRLTQIRCERMNAAGSGAGD